MNRNQNEGIVDKVKDALGMGDGDEQGETRDERIRDEPMADEPMADEPVRHERTGQEQARVGGRSPEMSNSPEAETGESPYGTRRTTDRGDYGARRDEDVV